MSELNINVKQGEEINIGLTIKANGVPMNLSLYNVRFQVKRAPLEKVKPIIDKLITTDSDMNTVGMITEPTNGKLVVHLTKEDTSFPNTEYSLIISLEQEGLIDIISSKCCNKAIYRICAQ